jgi:hypothetical protein
MVYGCSAHSLNLVEAVATPQSIMAPIVACAKFFRDHQKPAALLKEFGGCIPQLPNKTRWTSQRAALDSFVTNYDHYGRIIDDTRVVVPDNIRNFINNRGLVSEAKQMLLQLDQISATLNLFKVKNDNADLGFFNSLNKMLFFIRMTPKTCLTASKGG